MLARHPGEAVPGRGDDLAPVVDVDVGPMREGRGDLGGGCRIGGGDVAERLVGEHDAPAEGVVRLVALDDADAVRRILQLHQDDEEQTGRAAADADDVHEASHPGNEDFTLYLNYLGIK